MVMRIKMKLILLCFIYSIKGFTQPSTSAYKPGEHLTFKISYGLINAGMAELKLKSVNKNQQNLYFVHGEGWTTGMVNLFFPVRDIYQTYFDPKTNKPYHFVRKVNEGGYKKNKEILFDHTQHRATVIDHKHNTKKYFKTKSDIQDMISSVYFLRNLDFSTMKVGERISLNVFFDEENNKIDLIFKGREIIKTKFGNVKALIVKPMVQKGRVFKEEEGVTFWVSDDQNKIPLKIKAAILVGAISAELHEYKGLANPFPIIFN